MAVISHDGQLCEMKSDQSLKHLQNLLPMVDQLLTQQGILLEAIDGIAVSQGPGSFTGIRIGMATAKALAQVLNIPVVSVPTLQAFAWNLPDYSGVICPIFDARRSQVYGGAYRWQKEGQLEQVIPDGAYELEEYLELLAGGLSQSAELMFFGDGVELCRSQIGEWNDSVYRMTLSGEEIRFSIGYAPEDRRLQTASSVAQLGLVLWNRGMGKSLFEISPVYLRQAEAERKLLEKKAAKRAAAQEEPIPGQAPVREGPILGQTPIQDGAIPAQSTVREEQIAKGAGKLS